MKIYNSESKEKEINSVEEWFILAKPQGGEKQWKDTRSAKEMAKFWIDKNNQEKFKTFINNGILDFEYGYAIPEYKSKFDKYEGETRNHDLFILSKDNQTLITIEGKANEPFGTESFIDALSNGIVSRKEKPNSRKLNRVIDLYSNFFHSNDEIWNIKYQLTHWFAGSIQDAINHNSENVMMISFEFQSYATTEKNLDRNHKDFEKFVNLISEGRFTEIRKGEILGPIKNKYTQSKNLYIGYYSAELKEEI